MSSDIGSVPDPKTRKNRGSTHVYLHCLTIDCA